MEYQIIVNKYELNTLIAITKAQFKQEQQRFQELCRSGDMVGADLQSDTVTRLLILVGKLTNIPQLAEER